jgi:branched-chain amino acid transport system substrate-binding protein
MIRMHRFMSLLVLALALAGASPTASQAQKKYGPGVSDTEIKIGNTAPYSGPASAYAAAGISELAYFKMLDEKGGVNGRNVTMISLDDGYSPPKTVEQMRRLVESDGVLLVVNPVGTPGNSAVYRYLNQKKVPHLFVGSGATKFNDPEHFPWTMSWTPHYVSEGRIYARYLLTVKPDARIAILAQDDDLGKDYVQGLKDGLGDRAAKMIVEEATYEVTDPTVDSQIVSLQASGANVFFNVATPKFSAQAIRHAYDIGWHPLQFVVSIGSSIAGAIRPAGFERAEGVISAAYQKDPHDPQWQDDAGFKAWDAWMDKYNPTVDKSDYYAVYGYNIGMALTEVLRRCGDDLTRDHVMQEATHLDLALPMLLPGIRVRTSPTDLRAIKQMRLVRFDGQRWVLFGDVMEGS